MFLIALTVCTGDAGPTGPGGSQGSDGPQGSAGVPGISGYEIVSQAVTVPRATPSGFGTLNATADCPAGKMVIGGGVDIGAGTEPVAPTDIVRDVHVQDSYPNSSGTGWTVLITSGNDVTWAVTIYAICVNVA